MTSQETFLLSRILSSGQTSACLPFFRGNIMLFYAKITHKLLIDNPANSERKRDAKRKKIINKLNPFPNGSSKTSSRLLKFNSLSKWTNLSEVAEWTFEASVCFQPAATWGWKSFLLQFQLHQFLFSFQVRILVHRYSSARRCDWDSLHFPPLRLEP